MSVTTYDDNTSKILPEHLEANRNTSAGMSVVPEASETAQSGKRTRQRAAKATTVSNGITSAASLRSTQSVALPSETKSARVLALLQRNDGATMPEMKAATGWQAHSVRGFLSGTVRKKLGLNLVSEVAGDGARRYRINEDASQSAPSEPIELPPFGPFKSVLGIERPANEQEA